MASHCIFFLRFFLFSNRMLRCVCFYFLPTFPFPRAPCGVVCGVVHMFGRESGYQSAFDGAPGSVITPRASRERLGKKQQHEDRPRPVRSAGRAANETRRAFLRERRHGTGRYHGCCRCRSAICGTSIVTRAGTCFHLERGVPGRWSPPYRSCLLRSPSPGFL